MRILHIRLQNWRNFASVDVPLQRRAFLVGANASGKSNLLDAIRFVSEIATPGSGGLAAAVERRQGFSKIRCLAARRYPDVSIELACGDDAESPLWTYLLQLNRDNQGRTCITREEVRRDGQDLLLRPDSEDRADKDRLRQSHLEQVNANKAFRDLVDGLATVRYLHVVPQLVRDPSRSVGKTRDPYGGDLLEQIARAPEKVWKSRLKRIAQALQCAVPQLKALELIRDERGTPHLQGRYEHWRPNAGWQGEDQFSDGTLRLLGLLWAVLDGTGPLLLEEPELSLHAAVIRHIPALLSKLNRKSGRQVLVSTHSADLLADRGIDMREVLLLSRGENGTAVQVAVDDAQIKALVEADVPLGEAVLPRVAPQDVHQLTLFGERL